MSLRRLFPHTLAVVLFVLASGELGNSGPTTETIVVQAKMDDAMAQLWYDMPQSSMSANVELSGNTQPDCADAALRKARMALTQVGIRDAARRAAIQTVEIAKDIFEHAFGIGWAGMLGDAINLYLESGSVDELADNLKKLAAEKAGQGVAKGVGAGAGAVSGKTTGATSTAAGAVAGGLEGYPAEKGAGELAKYLWDQMNKAGDSKLFESSYEDPQCGTISVTFEMKVAPNGRRSIHFRASGDCQCKWPERVPQPMRLGRWTVIGNGDLAPQQPVVSGSTITIPYHLSNTHYIVSASCGCPEGGDQSYTDPGQGTGSGVGTVPDPPKVPVYERICWQRCGDLWSRWQELQREADRLGEAASRLEQELSRLQGQLPQAEQDVERERQALERMEQAVKDLEKIKGHPATDPRAWADRMRAAQWNLNNQRGRHSSAQYKLNELQQNIQQTQQSAQRMRQMADRRAAEAAAARDAYYRCAKSCYEQAMQAGEINALPQDIQDWMKTQPPPPTQQASTLEPTENMLVGVVVGADTRTGEHATARVVPNPKSFQNIPGLRVIEMTAQVVVGKNGRADVDKLHARIGDGPLQPCSGPIEGKVPVDGRPVTVTVGRAGGKLTSGEVPVTPGQPRIAPTTLRPSQFRTPALVQRGAVGVVHGPFDGRNLGTSVMVGGKRAEVLAESGGALYFVAPGDLQSGPTAIVVEEQGVKMKFKVAAVGLQMAAGRLQLEKGESASFTATVIGADQLPQSAWQAGDPGQVADLVDLQRVAPSFRAPGKGQPGVILLVLENLSPQVVSMSGGNTVQKELGQGSFAGGPYTYNGSVTAGQKGSFAISGKVIPFLAPVAGEYTQ